MSAPRLIALLQVGPYPVPVYECDEPIDVDDPEGQCDFNPYWIKLASRLEGPARWAVLIHELTHVALVIHGLRLGVYRGRWWQRVLDVLRGGLDDEEREELLCDLVGNSIAQALAPMLGAPPSSAGEWSGRKAGG